MAGTDHGHELDPHGHPKTDHEKSDVNVISITRFGLGLAAVTIFSVFLMYLAFGLFEHFAKSENVTRTPILLKNPMVEPPTPRLQGTPRPDLAAYQKSEDEKLTTYRWVDPDNEIVQIPIEQAMKIVAEKGLPKFEAIGKTPANQAGRATPAAKQQGN